MVTFAASVTRSDLGLATLDINDHTKYVVASEIMGATVTWDRKIVSSPYVDGDITVHRRRPNVTERFSVYCLGASQSELQTNIKTLIEAFTQNKFNLIMTLGGVEYSYVCEASDYTVEWSQFHFNAYKVKVSFNLLRNPTPLVGGV